MKRELCVFQKIPALLLAGLLAFSICACGTGEDAYVAPAPEAGENMPDTEAEGVQTQATVPTETLPQGESEEEGIGAWDEPLKDVAVEERPESIEAASLPMEEHTGKYYYDRLNEAEQLWYREMYAVMSNMKTEMKLSEEANETVGAEGLDKIFNCVMNDNPGLFYVEGYTYTLYTYGDELDKVAFSGTYSLSADEKTERQNRIDREVEACLAQVAADASEYEKVKYVYEYVICATEYNLEAEDNQNICSVFLGGESVCQGYAKAVQYLLNELGIEATLVVGNVHNTESHAWNLLKVDGAYYYLDATWGDASYQVQGSGSTGVMIPDISYDYLCVPYREMALTHTMESPVDMPECTAMEANYYVMEGAYFNSYDEDVLRTFFEQGYAQGRSFVTFRCADENVYGTVLEELITNQKIFDYLESADGKVAYAKDDHKLSMTFWLVNE